MASRIHRDTPTAHVHVDFMVGANVIDYRDARRGGLNPLLVRCGSRERIGDNGACPIA